MSTFKEPCQCGTVLEQSNHTVKGVNGVIVDTVALLTHMKRSQGKRASGKWEPMPEGMYRVVKLKPARGPKPGQSMDAYLYGRDMGHAEAKAAYRRKNGL